jgi:ribosomal protein S18 acetylase RimI-like enzyme
VEGITFGELKPSEFSLIKELSLELVKHLYQSPIYCPTDLEHFISRGFPADTRIFVAKDKEDYVGYIKLSKEGENYITCDEKMMNISGAFVKKEYRGQKVAEELLTYFQDQLKEEHYEYLGVDCETLNPTALRFWTKYFKPYTYSFARRIDERVIGFDHYFEYFVTHK